jgi:hypothetical protein
MPSIPLNQLKSQLGELWEGPWRCAIPRSSAFARPGKGPSRGR